MIDVSGKFKTLRYAKAECTVEVSEETLLKIRENDLPKKDPLQVAKVAGIMGAKKTSEIIPYCHPVPVEWVNVEFELGEGHIKVVVEVKAIYRTGVEMEALTAATVTALTLYDMLKPVDKNIVIKEVKLIEKKGGKSDFTEKYAKSLKAGVIVTSDSVSSGKKEDSAGKAIAERLKEHNFEVIKYIVIPDEPEEIKKEIVKLCDEDKVNLVITTGGTGLGPRDVTVDTTKSLIEKEIPGIPQSIRNFGIERTPYAMLSRSIAGLRGKTVIVNLPGSFRGSMEGMSALFPGLLHIFKMIEGGGHG